MSGPCNVRSMLCPVHVIFGPYNVRSIFSFSIYYNVYIIIYYTLMSGILYDEFFPLIWNIDTCTCTHPLLAICGIILTTRVVFHVNFIHLLWFVFVICISSSTTYNGGLSLDALCLQRNSNYSKTIIFGQTVMSPERVHVLGKFCVVLFISTWYNLLSECVEV